MQAASATRIETGVDHAAAALFASAAAYASFSAFAVPLLQPVLAAQSAAVAVFAYLVCVRALGAVPLEARKVPVPVFDVREIEPMALPELLLTEPCQADEPLVLDDILAEVRPDSRVVHLFDPAAMPTPGQLNRRIERHLAGGGAPGTEDASQALHDALAELRRSLR